MDHLKTFEGQDITPVDPIRSKQNEYVNMMRLNLGAIDYGDPGATKTALRNITVLRVYHHLSRIIRYTEMMDKLEDRLYESLDANIDNLNLQDMGTAAQLLAIQTKLQSMMLDSQKLLAPYLDNIQLLDDAYVPQVESSSPTTLTYDANTREKLRTAAQQVLAALAEPGEPDE